MLSFSTTQHYTRRIIGTLLVAKTSGNWKYISRNVMFEMKDTFAQNNETYYWSRFSETRLIEIEHKILNAIKTVYKTWFVKIKTSFNNEDSIWTISLNEESKNTPLVLLHGFGAGLCFWCLNFQSLSKDRPLYAIDLLGFGRSSRPNFSKDPLEAEQQMVEAIEEWRKEVKLDHFILLGHSFGGYLATSYAINYPDRIKHLILADPWGFTERPEKLDVSLKFKIMGILFYPFTYLNPLAAVRAAGPAGLWLINKLRGDIASRYGTTVESKELFSEYIYHCNCQNPSGETAFQSMKTGFAWAKNPMIHRFENVREDLPVTILYGENSWIRKMSDDLVKEKRPNAFTQIKYIVDAGHHINADQPELFNEVVAGICDQEDHGRTVTMNKSSKENVGNNIMFETHPEEGSQTAQIHRLER